MAHSGAMDKQLSKVWITGAWIVLANALRADEPPYPWVYVESLSTPTVHVVSTNAVDYDAIAGDTYAYTLQIYGDCGSNTRDVVLVQGNTPTYPQAYPTTIDTSDLVHPTRWLPSHFATQPDTKLPITWPLEMRQKVVAACNANLEAKLLVGIPRAAVLAQTWKLGKTFVGTFSDFMYCEEPDGRGGVISNGIGGGTSGFANVQCDPRTRDDVVHPVPEGHDPDDRGR